MITKIEKLVHDLKGGELSEQDAMTQIDRWLKESYLSGLRTANIKPKEWETVCEPCGKVLFPYHDKKRLAGITVIHGQCPRCNNKAFLIPIRDWMYAAGVGGLWD